MLRRDMLIEAKFAAGPDNAVKFRDGHVQVIHRAEHQRCDCSVHAGIAKRQVFGDRITYRYRNRGILGRMLGKSAQILLRLEGADSRHRAGVVAEVEPVACADLYNLAGKSDQRSPSLVCQPL
jgi:hypothetical protein